MLSESPLSCGADSDGDGHANSEDNCPTVPNPSQNLVCVPPSAVSVNVSSSLAAVGDTVTFTVTAVGSGSLAVSCSLPDESTATTASFTYVVGSGDAGLVLEVSCVVTSPFGTASGTASLTVKCGPGSQLRQEARLLSERSLLLSRCVDCQPGTYSVTNDAAMCVPCSEGCLECVSTTGVCVTCGPGLTGSGTDTCSPCSPHCTACDPEGCMTCETGYQLTEAGSCESQPEVSCLPGWTPYADVSGLEGNSSCVRLFETPETFSAASAACSAFPTGQLITVLDGLLDGQGLAGLMFELVGPGSAWVGASRSPLAPSRYSGWSWVDGTSSADQIFNCGSAGCGAWAAGEPRWVSV